MCQTFRKAKFVPVFVRVCLRCVFERVERLPQKPGQGKRSASSLTCVLVNGGVVCVSSKCVKGVWCSYMPSKCVKRKWRIAMACVPVFGGVWAKIAGYLWLQFQCTYQSLRRRINTSVCLFLLQNPVFVRLQFACFFFRTLCCAT